MRKNFSVNKISTKKQSGFTLVELVIVVVIMGFLAATAVPKFLDLTDQAKEANIKGMAGGFATGVALVRAQWEAEGRPKNGDDFNTVIYDGQALLLTSESVTNSIRPGYVVSSTVAASEGNGLGDGFDGDNCVDVWESILQQPPNITQTLTDLDSTDDDYDAGIDYFASHTGTLATSTCHFYLKETLTKSGTGYSTPNNLTTVGNSFTYQPATSEVEVHINSQ